MVNAIAASAAVRRERVLAAIATGKKWCPRCRLVLSRDEFGPRRDGRGDGLAGYCRSCAAAWKRDAAAAARNAANRARAWETEAARWAMRDPAPAPGPAVAPDVETTTLIVAVRWRLGVGETAAERVAALVAPSTASRGFGGDRPRDRVESFAWLPDAEAAALAQRAGVLSRVRAG